MKVQYFNFLFGSSLKIASLKIGAVIMILLTYLSVANGKEIEINTRAKIEAVIGAGTINRIQVQGGEIMEVVGDESKYSIYWSGDWQNLFLVPKIEVGEMLELSLVFSGGLVQDVIFTVGDVTAQTIIISIDGGGKDTGIHDSRLDQHLKEDITAMMRAMLEGERGKYYVREVKLNLTKQQDKQSGLSIKQIQAYRYQELSGAVLLVENRSGKPIKLEENYFNELFKGIVAINLPTEVINPRAKAKLLIISREEQ